MASKSVLYILKFRGPESCFEDSHDFVRFRFGRPKGTQETKFLDPSNGIVDCSNVTNLVVGFRQELANQLTHLLARQHKSSRIVWGSLKSGEFFAQAH